MIYEIEKYFSVISGIILLPLLLIGCEHAPPAAEGGVVEPNFRSIQTNIFSRKCAFSGCHAGPNPQQGMNLSEGKAYENIVLVPSTEQPELFRIQPGEPDSSYLYLKVKGDPRISGEQMPLSGSKLTQQQLDAIREWIANGAEQ